MLTKQRWQLVVNTKIIEPPHDKTNKMTFAPSEDSDQPRRIIVFAVRMKKPWILSYPLSALRRLWLDWATADLSLHWAHMVHFGGFVVLRLNYSPLSRTMRAIIQSEVRPTEVFRFNLSPIIPARKHFYNIYYIYIYIYEPYTRVVTLDLINASNWTSFLFYPLIREIKICFSVYSWSIFLTYRNH